MSLSHVPRYTIRRITAISLLSSETPPPASEGCPGLCRTPLSTSVPLHKLPLTPTCWQLGLGHTCRSGRCHAIYPLALPLRAPESSGWGVGQARGEDMQIRGKGSGLGDRLCQMNCQCGSVEAGRCSRKERRSSGC